MTPEVDSASAFDAVVVDRRAPVDRVALDETSWVDRVPGFVKGADVLFRALSKGLAWEPVKRWRYERYVESPRLGAASAPEGDAARILRHVRLVLEARYRVSFMGPGLLLYMDGAHSVAPHRDKELRYLDDTLIAGLSLGATRDFVLEPVGGGTPIALPLADGDLYVLGGRGQADWLHSVPRSAATAPRISATWRWTSRTGRPESGPNYMAPRRYSRG